MRRMLGVGVASISAVLLSACASAAGGDSKPFPLDPGARWVLTDEGGNELVIRVTRSRSGFLLRGFPGLPPTRVRTRGENVQAWDASAARWKQFLRLGAAVGTRYTVQLGSVPLWRSVGVTLVSRTETCPDTEGRGRERRTCVVLELQPPKGVADAGVERLVFAPGVGPVEVVLQTIAGPRRYALGEPGPPTR